MDFSTEETIKIGPFFRVQHGFRQPSLPGFSEGGIACLRPIGLIVDNRQMEKVDGPGSQGDRRFEIFFRFVESPRDCVDHRSGIEEVG